MPDHRDTISVIIPTYFGGSGLVQCVRSVLDELGSGDEIVVVADGESDRAWEGLAGPNVRVLVNPTRRGPAYARNRGAEAARGDLLFFVDADCVVAPGTLSQVRRAFEDTTLSALIGSYDDAPAHPSFPSQYRNLLHHYTHQRSRDEIRTFWAACGAVRQKAFFAVGGFDERYEWPCVEDIDLGYRLSDAGHRIRIVKDLQVKHLKEWTAASIVRTDVLLRAAPWTELLLRRGIVEDNLNTSKRSRVSLATVATALGLGLLSVPLLAAGSVGLAGGAALGAATWTGAAVAFNRPFYRFLRERRGRRFALRAVPWHLLYFACAGAGATLGAFRHLLGGTVEPHRSATLRASRPAPAASPKIAQAA
jgi:GT2 family glycosyltransferase